MKSSTSSGLKNPRYYLHYDYSPIFDRRAFEGTNSLLNMFPHNPAPTGSDSTHRISFLHYPDTFMKT